jgi:hypothetical protein
MVILPIYFTPSVAKVDGMACGAKKFEWHRDVNELFSSIHIRSNFCNGIQVKDSFLELHSTTQTLTTHSSL